MSLSFEELQNTLSSTIIDMQKKFEEERVGFKNKIKSLEDIIFQKEQEIEELKEKLVASKKKKIIPKL
jgi:predicted  nucleic acid-binding Zn-ribbon protein